MDTARRAAPDVDRLVLSVDAAMAAGDGERLLEIGRGVGLDRLEMLPHLGDFLLQGRLTFELAVARLRYMPVERVTDRLDDLTKVGLIERQGSVMTATEALRPVLDGIAASRGAAAAAAWSEHGDDVQRASNLAGLVADAASADHTVAVVHRTLPMPDGAPAALHRRLITLRLVRQHDHVAAWSGRGLTPPQIVALTKLWRGEGVEDDDPGVPGLVAAGAVDRAPLRITDDGRRLRRAIEDETDARAQQTFDVLGADEGEEFVAIVGRLPDGG